MRSLISFAPRSTVHVMARVVPLQLGHVTASETGQRYTVSATRARSPQRATLGATKGSSQTGPSQLRTHIVLTSAEEGDLQVIAELVKLLGA
jgi:hypothetical protein